MRIQYLKKKQFLNNLSGSYRDSTNVNKNNMKKLFLFQINLRLILVSGKTKEFLFSPSDSAGDIAQHVFDNWPDGKSYFRVNYFIFEQVVPDILNISKYSNDN